MREFIYQVHVLERSLNVNGNYNLQMEINAKARMYKKF